MYTTKNKYEKKFTQHEAFVLFEMFFHFLKGSPMIISTMYDSINYLSV